MPDSKDQRRADKKTRRPAVVNNFYGPVTIRGTTVYDEDGNPVAKVGIDLGEECDEIEDDD